MGMKENIIERYLIAEVKARGGIAPKWVSPGSAGVPDRLVFLPGGRVGALELKAPGQRPRPLQEAWLERLEALGVPVAWADGTEAVDSFLRALR